MTCPIRPSGSAAPDGVETDGGRDPRRVAIVPRRAAAAVAGAACGFRRPGALRDPLGGLVGGEAGRVGTVHSARTNSRDDVRPVDGDVDGALRDGALLRQSCFEDSIAKKRRELRPGNTGLVEVLLECNRPPEGELG